MISSWIKNRKAYLQLKAWIERYERVLIASFLLGGFFIHYFTFRALDVNSTLIGLGIYLLVAAACILYVAFSEKRAMDWTHPLLERLRLAIPLVLQLAFGSLFSMSLLFYWFSGTLSASWPVFLLLLVLILGNEVFRHTYLQPLVQITLFSFALCAYSSVLFPFLFNSLSSGVVLAGAILSLGVSLLLIWLLIRIAPVFKKQRWSMIASVMLVFGVLTMLYSLNAIPPIPLSLREAGIYHDVRRIGSAYQLIGEPESFWQTLVQGQTLHLDSTGRVYAYTVIYSPADLNTVIYHAWERYNEATRTWEATDRLSFPITGGRADGYHGYSFKTIHQPGKWRVTVMTARGQALGRMRVRIVL